MRSLRRYCKALFSNGRNIAARSQVKSAQDAPICYEEIMKYSLSAHRKDGRQVSTGHLTAASALAGISDLKGEGASQIQIFDIKTGRLMDEAALARADVQAQLMDRLRAPHAA